MTQRKINIENRKITTNAQINPLIRNLKSESHKEKAEQLKEWYMTGEIHSIKTVSNIIKGFNDGRSRKKSLNRFEGFEDKLTDKEFTISAVLKINRSYRDEKKRKNGTVYIGKNERTYTDERVVSSDDKSMTIKARNEAEARKKFIEQIENSKEYEHDYGDDVEYWVRVSLAGVQITNVLNKSAMTQQTGSIMQQRNFNASFLIYDNIPKSLNDLQITHNCFMDVFLHIYSPLIKKLDKKWFLEKYRLYNSFTETTPCSDTNEQLNNYKIMSKINTKLLDNYFDDNDDLDDDDKTLEDIKKNGVNNFTILKMCEELNISCYGFDIMNNCFSKFIAPSRNYPCFCYFSINLHAYVIIDSKEVKKLVERAKAAETHFKSIYTINEIEEDETKANPFKDIENIIEDIEVKDLTNYRDKTIIYSRNSLSEFLMEIVDYYNYVPKVKFEEKRIKNIYFNFNECNLFLTADSNIDLTWRTVYKYCNKVGIEFKNQSFQSVVRARREEFFNANHKRIKFSKQQRQEILNNQICCQHCGTELKYKEMQIDHITPLSAGGSNDLDNLQVLCRGCHFVKSKDEQENDQYVRTSETHSTFNTLTRNIFNSEACSMHSFVEKVKDIPRDYNHTVYTFDINKCRQNCLLNNKYDFPQFTVMDEPQEYKGIKKAGLYYVDVPYYFPLRGRGWYPLRLVEFCLEKGIIEESDIKFVIYSSLTIDKDYFNEFIKSCDVFEEHKKLAVNSMIGCFKPKQRDRLVFSGTLTEYCPDVFRYHVKNNKSNIIAYTTPNGRVLYGLFNEIETIHNETEAPIYNEVIAQEIINLYELKELIESKGGLVLDLNTDAISCVFKNDNPFKTAVVDNRLNIDDFFNENTKDYKYKLEDKERLKHSKMKDYIRSTHYKHQSPEWNIIEDPLTDDFSGIVEDIIMSDKSWYLKGRGGCGKTHLVNMLKQRLKEDNKHFKVLAPTNKAANLIDGGTIHKFVKSISKIKDYTVDYIFVDEISMVQEIFYNWFIFLKRLKPNIKFIIAGDFNQLLPVADRVEDVDYENSRALFELVDGNILHLSECRRADKEYFKLTDPKNVMSLNKEDFNNEEQLLNLCYTNKTRKSINAYYMNKISKIKKKNKATVIDVKGLEYDDRSQDMKLYAKLPIIARINCKNLDMANNEEYTVKEVRNKLGEVHVFKNSNPDENIVIPLTKFNWYFYPAYCITIHKSQGSTYKTPYAIYEWEKLGARLRYVALSRASNKDLVNIV